jgi:hypothetical protein
VGNVVRDIAYRQGRGYITAEDVDEALKIYDEGAVRLAVLEVLGRRLGAEDGSLCAFVAWRGRCLHASKLGDGYGGYMCGDCGDEWCDHGGPPREDGHTCCGMCNRACEPCKETR